MLYEDSHTVELLVKSRKQFVKKQVNNLKIIMQPLTKIVDSVVQHRKTLQTAIIKIIT